MADIIAEIIPNPAPEPVVVRELHITDEPVPSPNYAATVNPVFGQNITELDG
jgi:hypothetical protein